MEKLIVAERLRLNDLPVLHVFPRDLEAPSSTVLLYHGWQGSKEGQRITAELLASMGLRVIAPDLPHHGERDPFSDYNAPDATRQFWPVIMQAVNEAEAIKETVVKLGLAEPGRHGVAGSSAGGMVAASLLARDAGVKAAVLLNSCPCFEWLELQIPGPSPLTDEALTALRAYDPETMVESLAERPLLMLHGAADSILPVGGVRRFEALARPFYTDHPDRLVLTEYPRLNHWVTVGMVGAMRDWLLQTLATQ